MFRFLLYAVVLILFARAVIRLWRGIAEGMRGELQGGARQSAAGSVPQRGVQMARDPICGTFVVRERALTLSDGHDELYFCSDTCRNKYRETHRAGRTA